MKGYKQDERGRRRRGGRGRRDIEINKMKEGEREQRERGGG